MNASCVGVMTLIRCVFVRLVAEMSHQFLEQRIDIEFCVNLGKNASDIVR